MNDDQLDALVDAAAEGVAFDGLHVRRGPDGYAFRIDAEGRRGVTEVNREGLAESRLREVASDSPWFVSNWYYWTHEVGQPEVKEDAPPARKSHRYAFLRWLERADDLSVPERYEALAEDLTRSWGQLLLTARIANDGQRRYQIRHEDDEGIDLAELEVHADPLAARDLVTFDEKGRYRPLKTAPSLRTGWAFADLDGEGLVRAVDRIYPATVANWHLEREGELDVSHWAETAERQTGIYDVVEDLPREAVAWMTEACCVDSQCLKRREWDYTDDEEIDVPRGEGEFPCREPCSLVIAAARRWTQLEQEEPRTYEFELTPSEKEQVEAIIDAVADGRIDEIREADLHEGANRYRARYLRAKRVDEEGNLPGTETDE